jgi:tetratricopeptide (TPR) repeat protein
MLAFLPIGEEDFEEATKQLEVILAEYEGGKQPDRLYYRTQIGLRTAETEREVLDKEISFPALKSILGPMRGLLSVEPDEDWRKALALTSGAMSVLHELDQPKPNRAADEGERRRKAEQDLRDCADSIKETHAEWHYYRAFPLFFLGESMARRGDLEGGAKTLRESLEVVRNSVGWEHQRVPYMMGRYARILHRMGQPDKARSEFSEMLDITRKRFGNGHHYYANALMAYASFLGDIPDYSGMKKVCEEALAIYEKKGGAKPKLYKRCKDYLAKAQAGGKGM